MPDNNYKTIAEEMETGTFHKDVWVKAVENSGGKHSRATSIYIKLRSEQLYLQNTPFHKRVLHALQCYFNPRTKLGLAACAVLILTVSFVSLLVAQPALKRNARLGYENLCAQGNEIIGYTQQEMVKRLGNPSFIDTSGSAFLVYIYNPSSAFCFGNEQFDFKVFVDTRTARVSGWEENPLLRTSALVQ